MSANQPHPAREEIFAYRDGELMPDRRVVIEAHVLGCHACRELIDDVSRMEADLSVGAPVPKEAYFERLSEQVMAKVAAADTTPVLERRHSEAEAEWEEKRTVKPKLPWFALASTASAGLVVIVVGVLLVREGAVWRRAPSVAVLERSAPDAARSRAAGDSASAGLRKGQIEEQKLKSDEPATLGESRASKQATVQQGQEEVAQQRAGDLVVNRQLMAGSKDSLSGAASEPDPMAFGEDVRNEKTSARAAAPEAAVRRFSSVREPAALTSLLERYGLPPVWGPEVPDETVLRAEPALRSLYRTGGLSTAPDSARARLYLAEAARVRAGGAPDAAAVREIVNHYRRAIRLAGGNAEIRRVAARRMADFLSELGDEPALHSP